MTAGTRSEAKGPGSIIERPTPDRLDRRRDAWVCGHDDPCESWLGLSQCLEQIKRALVTETEVDEDKVTGLVIGQPAVFRAGARFAEVGTKRLQDDMQDVADVRLVVTMSTSIVCESAASRTSRFRKERSLNESSQVVHALMQWRE